MKYANVKVTSLLLAQEVKLLNITQEEIAEATKVSQSQVSRVLSGNSKQASRVFIEICNYVFSKRKGITPELVKENEELIQAIASVWDGSAKQSKVLVSIIMSLGGLCSHSNQR